MANELDERLEIPNRQRLQNLSQSQTPASNLPTSLVTRQIGHRELPMGARQGSHLLGRVFVTVSLPTNGVLSTLTCSLSARVDAYSSAAA